MKLEGKDGKPVYVNPAQVSVIEEAKDDPQVTVIFVPGFHVVVRGTPDVVAEMLGHA